MTLETYVRIWYDVFMQKSRPEYKQQNLLCDMNKADVLLILGCLVAALLLGLFFMVCRKHGGMACVSCDGVEIVQIDLGQAGAASQTQYYLILYTEGQDAEIVQSEDIPEVSRDGSYNLFSVTEGVVAMESADCRDQICVRHKPISAAGESMICLPHRLVIEISGGEDLSSMEGYSGESADETLDGVVR